MLDLKRRLHSFSLTALAVVLTVSVLAGCQGNDPRSGNNQGSSSSQIDWNNLDQRAEQFVMALVNGDYAVAAEGFDDAMNDALGVEGLKQAWEGSVRIAGEFISVVRVDTVPHSEYDIYEVITKHQRIGIKSRVVFSADGKVTGLFFSYVENE
ncbi:MAG: DUF3887 domain-containing protein [Coriobacteriales bacterium]|jgi:hypothetical protein|nr:DUF3887 domain-containing protein [Coriobacteriales bacterium]